MAGIEDFRGLDGDQLRPQKELAARGLIHRVDAIRDPESVEVEAVGDEAGLVLPILEELDGLGNPQHGPYN